MNRIERTRADQSLRFSKARDRAVVLPLVGVLLFISPLAGIYEMDFKIAGVPFTLIGLFSVWALLIGGAFALAGPLRDGDAGANQAEAGDQSVADDSHR